MIVFKIAALETPFLINLSFIQTSQNKELKYPSNSCVRTTTSHYKLFLAEKIMVFSVNRIYRRRLLVISGRKIMAFKNDL